MWYLNVNPAAIRPGWKNKPQGVGSGFLADNDDERDICMYACCQLKMRLFRTCDVCVLRVFSAVRLNSCESSVPPLVLGLWWLRGGAAGCRTARGDQQPPQEKHTEKHKPCTKTFVRALVLSGVLFGGRGVPGNPARGATEQL